VNPQPLFDWMNERHAIYLRRQSEAPAPWTSDPILQQYRFCNVYRELDTVTIWIEEHIRRPYKDHMYLWFMLAIARQINWPPTLLELLEQDCFPFRDQWSWERLRDVMRSRQARGEQVYTGAYMLRGPIQGDPSGSQDKPNYTALRVLQPLWEARHEVGAHMGNSIQHTVETLSAYHGWGPFLAYEVATDLRHCPGWLDEAPDILSWANAGPGAYRGLNRLHGRPLTQHPASALEEMRHLLAISPLYLASHMPDIELRDIEHSLCEFDKYTRVKTSEGRPRAKFTPKG
jgi:alpha-glutamyl/putrescinyl thymine pyrophosphorylase clade 1